MQKQKSIPVLLGMVLVLALSACGKKDDGKASYQLVENGCDTGKQEFSADSKDAAMAQLCDAIQDDKRNHGCADGLRRDYFAKNCSGTYTPR